MSDSAGALFLGALIVAGALKANRKSEREGERSRHEMPVKYTQEIPPRTDLHRNGKRDYLVSMTIEVPYSDGTKKPHTGFRYVSAMDAVDAVKEAHKLYAGYADIVYVGTPMLLDEALEWFGPEYIRMYRLNF